VNNPPQRRPVPPERRTAAERPNAAARPTAARPAAAARPTAARPAARNAPRKRPPPPPKGPSYTGRTLLSLLSVAVLVATGYAWQNFKALTENLTTTDVIDAAAGGEKPADGAIDILMVGMDSRTDAKGNPLPQQILDELQAGGSDDGGLNTDTLILMHIPNDGGKAVAISFPRDSYVDIAGGYGRHKINSAYGYGKNDSIAELQKQGVKDPAQLETQSKQEGAKNLIATIQDLTGVTIDHYAEINLVGFYEITNAIGGVDVCLTEATQDDFSGADFAAGPQTIQGRQALSFVRQRHGLLRGDLDRIVRQQVFMAGLAKKMLSAGVLSDQGKLKALIEAVTKSIVLDKQWEILGFANQMKGMSGGNMEFKTIPTGNPDLQTDEDGSAVEVTKTDVRRFVKNLNVDPAKAGTTTTPTVDNATITVDVRNASGVAGLAGKVLQSLVAKGFTEGVAANAESGMTTSIVRFGKGGEAGGEQVAKVLGGLKTEEDGNIPAGHVRVFVGSDYDGPGAQNFTAGLQLGLDGARQQQQPADTDPPITADGVRCVN
jgi:LCP family protein required for cell wall assembly